MCVIVLYCIVLYCTVLYCTTLYLLYCIYCIVLIVMYCIVLYCTVLYCIILSSIEAHCHRLKNNLQLVMIIIQNILLY
jgi:hypothetical protein